MYPTLMDLTPEEISTIPAWDMTTLTDPTNNNNNNRNSFDDRQTVKKILNECLHKNLPNWPGSRSDGSGRCCLGAYSSGAGQNFVEDPLGIKCAHDLKYYRGIRDLALTELEANPIVQVTVGTSIGQSRDGGDGDGDSDGDDGGDNNSNNNDHDTENIESVYHGSMIKCDLCWIIYTIAQMKHNRLSIVGDSVQAQVFDGLECELHRRGFVMKSHDTKEWEVRSVPNRPDWKYGVTHTHCFDVILPEWMLNFDKVSNGGQKTLASEVSLCYHKHYRPHMDMEQHTQIASESDVMVINYGLHYNPVDKAHIIQEFTETYQALLRLSKNITDCHFIIRETSAQHFNTKYGEFGGLAGKKKCYPIKEVPETSWRRSKLNEAATKENFTLVDSYGNSMDSNEGEFQITVLPFYQFSNKLYESHEPFGIGDCSHFCYTPHIYYPIWRHLRITMDRLTGKQ